MQPSYTEHDTERARQHERMQAGSYPPMQPVAPVGSFRQRNNVLALGLVGIGALMLISRIFGDGESITGGLILLTISSCFLFFSFSKRIFGLLIPGSILAGLSIGVPFADLTNGVSIVWGLALAFAAIAFLGMNLFRVRSSWAMIPAAILFMVGVIIAIANLPGIFGISMIWIPLMLIGAGLYLGWGRRARI